MMQSHFRVEEGHTSIDSIFDRVPHKFDILQQKAWKEVEVKKIGAESIVICLGIIINILWHIARVG